jgi:hypothetical protein
MKQIDLFRRKMTLFDSTRDINRIAPLTEFIHLTAHNIAQRAREPRTTAALERMIQVQIRNADVKTACDFVCEPAHSTPGRMQS